MKCAKRRCGARLVGSVQKWFGVSYTGLFKEISAFERIVSLLHS